MGRPHAPKIDHPYVFSVSQLETFELCNRKWAFEKIDKLEGKENVFAELGQRVHDVLEKYLEKAVPIDRTTKEGKIAFPGLVHLPMPKTKGMRVEKWFAIKFGVAAYRGLKDVEIIVDGKEPIIIDHKSTRNFRWKKSKKELLVNLQAGIYAADTMKKTGWKTVILKWVYYATEGKPKAEPVPVRITEAQVEEILTRADEIAQRMVQTLQTRRRALDVYPNFSACEAYGGCGYKEHCVRKPSSVLRSIMAQKREENMGSSTSEFLANLKNRNASKKTSEETKAKPSVKLKDAETVKINPPEREETEQPRPPSPKKINGKWENAVWDDAAWAWVYPSEEAEKESAKEAKAAAASKKVEDKKAGSVATKGTKVKPAVQEIEDEPEEQEEEQQQQHQEEEQEEEPEEVKPVKTKPAATKPAASKLDATKPVMGLTIEEKRELVASLTRSAELLAKHLDATIPF